MRIRRIPKGRGRFRTLYVPSRKEKTRLRALLPLLEETARNLDVHGVQHGFVKGRNPVTNALPHRGFQYTLSMDLQDFFDNVRREHLLPYVPEEVLDLILVDGAARQGLPTSPSAANIAAAAMDARIWTALQGRGVYTRYADDLTVSANSLEVIQEMRDLITSVAREYGWEVHPRKTKIQWARRGRRIITGVSVGDSDVKSPRRVRRRVRAGWFRVRCLRRDLNRRWSPVSGKVTHPGRLERKIRSQSRKVRGLEEWTKVKLPRGSVARTIRRGSAGDAASSGPGSVRPVVRKIRSLRPNSDQSPGDPGGNPQQ